MADLVEKVAQLLCVMTASDCHPDEWKPEATAAIRLVLEEAAKVADDLSDAWDVEWHDPHMDGKSDGASDVAAAIRSMMPR